MQKITAENFEQFIGGRAVLVDFWATWCGPCMRQGEIMEALVKEHPEYADRIGKINVDDDRELAIRYGINAIPSLFIFENGQVKKSVVGMLEPKALLNLLQENF